MSDPIFDLDSWNPMFPIDDDTAVDSDGHFIKRMNDGMALDLDTGRMHFTTSWPEEEPDEFSEGYDDLDDF